MSHLASNIASTCHVAEEAPAARAIVAYDVEEEEYDARLHVPPARGLTAHSLSSFWWKKRAAHLKGGDKNGRRRTT